MQRPLLSAFERLRPCWVLRRCGFLLGFLGFLACTARATLKNGPGIRSSRNRHEVRLSHRRGFTPPLHCFSHQRSRPFTWILQCLLPARGVFGTRGAGRPPFSTNCAYQCAHWPVKVVDCYRVRCLFVNATQCATVLQVLRLRVMRIVLLLFATCCYWRFYLPAGVLVAWSAGAR